MIKKPGKLRKRNPRGGLYVPPSCIGAAYREYSKPDHAKIILKMYPDQPVLVTFKDYWDDR